ncbi:MAG: tetraacyldisaccharide 4'-kinase [Alphaproteobacteria bacterium]|nr:tetraacyldisaccharide 4'-kinase [Alphaproteobacteria bacterium]
MPLEEPSWWYAEGKSDLRTKALLPIAKIYGAIAQRRFIKAQAYRSKLPVICVGNFTAGGTGKTPLSLFIAGLIRARGGHPAFLTRGYSGRLKGPLWVNAEVHGAADIGDEPLLLAGKCPTVVSRDRAEGARLIEELGAITHIIMDDGLQNPQLAKTLSIAVVDGRRGVGNGEVIPAGPLRAPLDFQFTLADCVVFNGPVDGAEKSGIPGEFPGPVLSASVVPNEAARSLVGERVVAYAGIGNPQRFIDLVSNLGAQVVGTRLYKDHHAFSEEDAKFLLELAASMGAKLVTTEKDFVRLRKSDGERARLAGQTTPIGISIGFKDGDEKRLEALVEAARV